MFGFVINGVSGVDVLTLDDVVIDGDAGVSDIDVFTHDLRDTFACCSDVILRGASIDDFGVAGGIGKVIIPFGSRIRSTCCSLRCIHNPLISRIILNF